MKTIQKAITAVTLAAVLICMTASIKAKAEIIEAAEIISDAVPGADLTSIAYAYNNLTTQQKLIADYLMGAYNYTYLCARGFSFNIDQTETNMTAQLGAIGERIWQFATTAYGWKSRFNEVFRQYASSIIVYAAKINVSFDTWIADILSGTRTVYIEYSENAFDAWTEFYNDPSGDGIASFGRTYGSWQSGSYYDFAFVGYSWKSASAETNYNNFILNNSPVLYSNTINVGSDVWQCMVGNFSVIVNSLYVLRSSTAYSSFRWGYLENGQHYLLNNTISMAEADYQLTSTGIRFNSSSSVPYEYNIITLNNGYSSLNDLVSYAFDQTPINLSINGNRFKFWYPFVSHVYLVDDLTTLSNIEEVFNVDDFNIVAPGMDDFIISPNGKMLIPGYAPIEDPFAELWDVSVDVNGDTVTEDDFNTQIVNNTVINNYVVDASDKINVPVDWFENELTDQLANDSIPFLAFARDCIDCLGDLQLYFYGAIVFGLGGGILKKLIL